MVPQVGLQVVFPGGVPRLEPVHFPSGGPQWGSVEGGSPKEVPRGRTTSVVARVGPP